MTPGRLTSGRAATSHQKEWFKALRQRVSDGEPYALVNADTPHELLRAMQMPYVVSQWWASIVSAKQLAGQCLAAVAEAGYPDDVQQYDAIPFGSCLLGDREDLWGGLPQPTLVVGENSGDATRKIFEMWREMPNTEVVTLERTAADPAPPRWWELVPHRWEEAFGSARLDLMVAEQRLLIERLEDLTGRRFDPARLRTIMDLANRQAELNRDTRDRIAEARPHPASLTQGISAVMVPQWHRGTDWAVQAAERLNAEVRGLIAGPAEADADDRMQPAASSTESLRLMWIGRGIWGDLDLYDHFEETYGAVFVWSMYLAIAADGYVRYGDDPERALAARFVGLTDQLYAPPWSSDWYVKEAVGHGVDGVVHLVAEDVAGSQFTTLALEDSGVPVLEIHGSNTDARSVEPAAVREQITQFLVNRLGASRQV